MEDLRNYQKELEKKELKDLFSFIDGKYAELLSSGEEKSNG